MPPAIGLPNTLLGVPVLGVLRELDCIISGCVEVGGGGGGGESLYPSSGGGGRGGPLGFTGGPSTNVCLMGFSGAGSWPKEPEFRFGFGAVGGGFLEAIVEP